MKIYIDQKPFWVDDSTEYTTDDLLEMVGKNTYSHSLLQADTPRSLGVLPSSQIIQNAQQKPNNMVELSEGKRFFSGPRLPTGGSHTHE